MAHIGDFASLFTALGIFLTAVTSFAAFVQSWRNGKVAQATASAVVDIKKQTDGINEQLVKVTGKAALAEGTAAGIVEGHAAGLEQGRNEERKGAPA